MWGTIFWQPLQARRFKIHSRNIIQRQMCTALLCAAPEPRTLGACLPALQRFAARSMPEMSHKTLTRCLPPGRHACRPQPPRACQKRTRELTQPACISPQSLTRILIFLTPAGAQPEVLPAGLDAPYLDNKALAMFMFIQFVLVTWTYGSAIVRLSFPFLSFPFLSFPVINLCLLSDDTTLARPYSMASNCTPTTPPARTCHRNSALSTENISCQQCGQVSGTCRLPSVDYPVHATCVCIVCILPSADLAACRGNISHCVMAGGWARSCKFWQVRMLS